MALAITLPPASTALFLTGLISLEAYLALNTAAPLALATLYIMYRLGARKTVLGEAEPCNVCSHPERRRIEERMAAGEPPHTVAEEYGLEEDELTIHTALHTEAPSNNEAAWRLDVERELSRILDELKEMQNGLKRLEKLFEAGEVRIQDYLKLLAERRALMRDIRTLLIIMEKTGAGKAVERDLGALLRRLRGPRHG